MYGATAGKKISDPQVNDRGLLSIESDLQALSSNLARIGTPSDGATLRDNIRSLRGQLKRKISEEQVRQSNQQDRFTRDKLQVPEQLITKSQQLRKSVSRLHELMETERRLLQRYPSPKSTAVEDTDWGGTTTHTLPLLRTAALPDVISAERDAQSLEELQRDIGDLQEIQDNLTRLVLDQGEDIGIIEANVEVAHDRVMEGRRALGEATRLQSSSRRKKCCIITCLLVVIAIPTVLLVLLIILLAHFLG